MRRLRIALAAIFAVLLISFIIQNFDSISIRYWPFGRLDAPVWFVTVASAALGILAFHFYQAFRRSKKNP